MRLVVAARAIILLFASSVTILTFQNCSQIKFTPATNISPFNFCEKNPTDPSCLPAPAPVCNFNGAEVASGQSVNAYQNSTVPYGFACEAEQRQCLNGALSGSYNFSSCSVGEAASCLFNGQTIPHGGTVEAFLNSAVPFGGTCSKQVRTCNNGTLSGNYSFASCNVNAAANCLFNGQTVAHGQAVNAFQNSTVVFGATCVSQQRVCSNGVLSGSYTFASCTPNSPASCQFNGRQIAHNEIVKAYQNSTVPFGQVCVDQDRVCSNGTLSGSYNFASCTPGAPADCTFNGTTVAHGQSITAYAASTVPFGSTCTGVTRTCTNGSLSNTGSFSSCNVGAPADCLIRNQTVAHGQSVTAFPASSVPFGSVCEPQTRTCNNGNLSGTASYNSLTCNVGAPADCTFNGQAVAHGQTVTAFLKDVVPYGTQCSSIGRKCTNGSLDGDAAYTFSNCMVARPPGNVLTGPSQVREGVRENFVLTTENIPDGTNVMYCYDTSGTAGRTNANDFNGGCSDVTIINNRADVFIEAYADLLTEGDELSYIRITLNNTVITQNSFTVLDESKTPTGTLTGPNAVREGETTNFVLTTQGVTDGTTASICFDISGTTGRTNVNDWTGCVVVSIMNNTANVPIMAKADLQTEGNEASYARVIIAGIMISQANFNVIDTSK